MREHDTDRVSSTAGPANFIGKWRARWPEWTIASAFLPAPGRELAFAWFALLQELTDAAWGGEEATPGLAKLAWWNEELQGWAKGARRHPLGELLQSQPVDWLAIAASLRELQASRDGIVATGLGGQAQGVGQEDRGSMGLGGQALGGADLRSVNLAGVAQAIAAGEQVVFADGGGDTGSAGEASGPDVDVVIASLLAERCLVHGQATTRPAQAGVLQAAWPDTASSTRPRRMQAALLRARLDAAIQSPGKPMTPAAPWRSLWLAWRSARSPLP